MPIPAKQRCAIVETYVLALNRQHLHADGEDAAMAELNLENYDDDSEEENDGGRRLFGSSNPGMAFYRSVRLFCIDDLTTF